MLTGFSFAVDQAAVDGDFEDSAGARNQIDGSDRLEAGSAEFSRQTGGSRLVVSHLAVFDRHALDHGGNDGGGGGAVQAVVGFKGR